MKILEEFWYGNIENYIALMGCPVFLLILCLAV